MEKGEDDSGEEGIMTYAPLLFEILQCVGLPMQEILSWPMGPIKNFVMSVLDYMDFQFFTTTPNMSYILFSILFIVVMASVFIFIALLFVFKNGDSRVPLPLVHLLRIITNASVTFGYQPMITIIFMIVDCDFSSGKGMCDMYPEVPCWEGAQAVFNSLSLFTLVVFVPFTQFVILFLYEFDVKHDVLLAAHSGRYEFIEMACKCILTAESQWLSSYFVLRCLSCILMFGFCMFYIMWMQPYHSLHTNIFASAQYGWTLTSSFYSWVSLYTEGAGALVIVLFWITYIAISFFSTFFVAVYARKIYLARCAITFNFKIPVRMGIPFQNMNKPFYSEIIRYQTISNQINLRKEPPYFIPKIKKVSQIDAAIRFIWNKQVRRRKPQIDFASYIYDEGLKRFPMHSTLRTHYALFLCHYKKDWDEAMKQFSIALQLGATIDKRWIIFYMSKIYEQANSGADLKSADVLSLFRYKNHLNSAETNYFEAK
ncbi:MAG: hypothetical protein EZS28_021449 [Streblomastix strix]|uniref:Uncharacterized protein n=1 Tax=Streblomastix strix TaxID=222440 RepID=A0A5J4VKM7_9EUKA|nr:MAG: hypothetical protein EZS28_021449 [Streblomastix strix]